MLLYKPEDKCVLNCNNGNYGSPLKMHCESTCPIEYPYIDIDISLMIVVQSV